VLDREVAEGEDCVCPSTPSAIPTTRSAPDAIVPGYTRRMSAYARCGGSRRRARGHGALEAGVSIGAAKTLARDI
jgi:hypothetical protein